MAQSTRARSVPPTAAARAVLIDSYPTPARRSELEALRRFVDRLDDVGHGTEAEA